MLWALALVALPTSPALSQGDEDGAVSLTDRPDSGPLGLPSGGAPASTPPPSPAPTPNREAYEGFGRYLEKEFNNDNHSVITDHYDWVRLYEAASQGLPLTGAAAIEARQSLKTWLEKDYETTTEYSELSYVSERNEAGKDFLTFRMEGGMFTTAYFDVEVYRSGAGTLTITDVYNLALGDRDSEMARRFLLGELAKQSPSALNSLPSPEVEIAKHADAMFQARDSYLDYELEEALKTIESLPKDLRALKPVFLLELYLKAEHKGEIDYRLLSKIRAADPLDPALALFWINNSYIVEDHEIMVRDVRELRSRLSRDPYLCYYETLSHVLNDDLASAQKAAAECAVLEPGGMDDLWCQFEITNYQKEYESCIQVLNRLEKEHECYMADMIETDELYEGLRNSAAGKVWLSDPNRLR